MGLLKYAIIYADGREESVEREMTEEEKIAIEQENQKAQIKDTSAPEPTTEERIAALEDELAAAKILLGLEE